jgi:hypothetical protein
MSPLPLAERSACWPCAPASAAGTLAWIEAFGRTGEVSPDLEDRLAAAFDHVTSLQLR